MNTPVHSVQDTDGDDTNNVGEQGLAGELQEAGTRPALDWAATMYRFRTGRRNIHISCNWRTGASRLSYRQNSNNNKSAAEHERPHQVGPTKQLQL